MKKIIIVLLASFGFVMAGSLDSRIRATERFSSTIKDQAAVEVTIYNSNIGLVKDRRSIDLRKGVQEFRFMDVASQIIPASVNIKSMGGRDGFIVLEQDYEYDLLSPSKLIDKYVGREVKIISRNPYTDKEETATATILSNNEGRPVFKIGDEITFNHPGRIIFPQLPENLTSNPTLLWLIDSDAATKQEIEALYLTNGINWRADYILVLNDKDTTSTVSGWVTIDNKSGAAYNKAILKLVAGDIHRVVEPQRLSYDVGVMPMAVKAATQLKEESLFEYHIYGLDRRTTIGQNQIKQINLLNARDVPVRKEFVYQGQDYYFRGDYGEPIRNERVGVFLEIANKKENNLGLSLPKGTLRVYKHDTDGSLQFVGEDLINHTPKNEKVRVRMGNAFDVAVLRKQMSWERAAKNIYEVSFEISLRNQKKEDIVVKVIERVGGDWTVLASSHKHEKEDSRTISFNIPVKKNGETKLAYKARIKY